MVSQDFIDRLIKKQKYIQQDIVWSKIKRNEKYQTFRVDIISEDGDYLIFDGHSDTKKERIISLALVYNREFPLVRIDKKHHKNPREVNLLEFRGWHKHKYNIIWEDNIAIDVSHEFNDDMLPEVIIEQFKRENNIRFIEGKSYQKLLYESILGKNIKV